MECVVSERLSDEAWLKRALNILNDKYRTDGEEEWSARDALNRRWGDDPEELSELVWVLDPEKHIDLSRIPDDFYRPPDPLLFRALGWILWGVFVVSTVVIGVKLGLDEWAWYFKVGFMLGSAVVAILLMGLGGSLIWDTDQTRAKRVARQKPLTLHVLLEYRKEGATRH
jgi:hypothetical protein